MAYVASSADGDKKSIMIILTLGEAKIFKSRFAVQTFVSEMLPWEGEVVLGKTVSIRSGHALFIDLHKVTEEQYQRVYVPAMERVGGIKRVEEAEASTRREGDEAYGRQCRERSQAIASSHSNLTSLMEELTRIHGSSGGTGPKRRRFARLATQTVARSLNIASHNLKESKEPEQSDDE